MLRWITVDAWELRQVGNFLALPASQPFPDPINRPTGGQPLQECRPISHWLSIGKLQCRQKRLLKTLIGISLISEQTIRGPPHSGPFPAHQFIPINHGSTRLARVSGFLQSKSPAAARYYTPCRPF
jgi:hypothetical protein